MKQNVKSQHLLSFMTIFSKLSITCQFKFDLPNKTKKKNTSVHQSGKKWCIMRHSILWLWLKFVYQCVSSNTSICIYLPKVIVLCFQRLQNVKKYSKRANNQSLIYIKIVILFRVIFCSTSIRHYKKRSTRKFIVLMNQSYEIYNYSTLQSVDISSINIVTYQTNCVLPMCIW